MKAYKVWHKKKGEYIRGKHRDIWSKKQHAVLAARYTYYAKDDLEVHEFDLSLVRRLPINQRG